MKAFIHALLLSVPLLAGHHAGNLSILFVGDSLTTPLGDGPSYATMVGDALVAAGTGDVTARAGCWGVTTWQWSLTTAAPGWHCDAHRKSLWDALVAPQLPRTDAYILLGTNDALHHYVGEDPMVPVEPGDYAMYLIDLINRLHAAGIPHVVLLSPPDILNATPDVSMRLKEYREYIGWICRLNREFPGVRCGPDLSRILRPGDYVDDSHPSLAGDQKVADAILVDLWRRSWRAAGPWRTRRGAASRGSSV